MRRRHGGLRGEALVSGGVFRSLAFARRLGRGTLVAVALSATTACSLIGGDKTPDVAAATPNDVNWAFANEEAMTKKIAALEAENKKLTNTVNTLRRRLNEAERLVDAIERQRRTEAQAEAARVAAAAAPKGAARPIISAPDAQKDLPDAATAVERSPRLVQPAFASASPVFENEAVDEVIDLQSVLFGVHLASYRELDDARSGWRRLQRENPDELGLLEPRIENIKIEGRGVFLRLIAGGFASEDKATALCDALKASDVHCRVVGFNGERLALNEGT